MTGLCIVMTLLNVLATPDKIIKIYAKKGFNDTLILTLRTSLGTNIGGTYSSGVCTLDKSRWGWVVLQPLFPTNPSLPAHAVSSMCAQSAKPPFLPVLVVNVTLPTPINPDALQQAWIGYDQTEAAFLLDGFNHPLILHHKDIVERKLSKELQMGRKAGPFVSPPFHDYQSSPLGVMW